MDMDYAEIYKDVNQVTRTVPTRECSEVMAIQRLYVRVNDLDVKGLRNVEVVKQVVVFADVVEVEGGAAVLELPGSSQITIVCRVLLTKNPSGAVIGLSSLAPVKCRGQERLNKPSGPRTYSVTPISGQLDPSDGQIVTILAMQVVAPAGASLQVQCPVLVDATLYDSDGYHPDWFYNIKGTANWSSLPFGGDSTGTTAATARSYETRTSFPHITWTMNEQDWQPSFRVVLPEILPPRLVVDPSILLGMETNTLASELIFEFQREAVQTTVAAHRHMMWLDGQFQLVVGSSGQRQQEQLQSQQSRNLHFRVQSLLKLHRRHFNNAPLVVPPLKYEQYDKLINLMTRAAESYDNDFKNLNLLIQQNEILGNFLLDQNKAFAQKERDMEVHHSQLVDLQDKELELTKEKFDTLVRQLDQQNREMEKARDDVENEIKQFREKQTALAVIGVLIAIAQVCFAIFSGGATAGTAVASAVQLSQTASVLQSVVTLLQRIEKVAETLYAFIDFLSEMQSLEQFVNAPEMPELPTDAEWSIFENEIVAVAETMPTEISQVPVWKAKCKNVAAVGREIINTAVYMQKLQYDLAVNRMLQQIAQQQAERLESLQIKDLDNYLEMATELDMRTTRILKGLLKVLSLQTGALSYHYLLEWKPLTGWVRMDAVWKALLKNATDAVTALSLSGPSNDFEVRYTIKGIPVNLLLDGMDWIFDIPVDDPAFGESLWSRVRIEYVEMKFNSPSDGSIGDVHLPTTTGGQIYILLQAGRFFEDRLRDQVLQYEAAVPLAYQYAYRLASGETTVSNRPSISSSTHYMRMTPFTRWSLRLSASAPENRGLAFPTATTEDATTQITLTFYVTARRQISTRTL